MFSKKNNWNSDKAQTPKAGGSFILKSLSLFMVFILFSEVLFPTLSFALTSGPNAPEFSGFTPVATTDMVNLSSGDFQYNLPVLNIPGPDGAGYALSLSYNSGVTCESEASWVGFGWNLNPGAINRSLRGIPDEYAGEEIDVYNKSIPNWTVAATSDYGMEIKTVDLSFNKTLRYNNFNGYMASTGMGIGASGLGKVSMNFDPNGTTFSAQIDIKGIVKAMKKLKDNNWKIDFKKAFTIKETKKKDNTKNKKTKVIVNSPFSGSGKNQELRVTMQLGGSYGLASFADINYSPTQGSYRGIGINWHFSTQVNPAPISAGMQTGISGNFNMQHNMHYTRSKAYGYTQTDNFRMGSYGSQSDGNVLWDYYMEKEGSFNKRDYFIGMPFSNYDIFSVQSEGLSGGFRAHTNSIGKYLPPTPEGNQSKFKIRNLGFEVMFGPLVGVGVDIAVGNKFTTMKPWTTPAATFDSEKCMFRFNGDMGGKIEYDNQGRTDVESANVRLVIPILGMRAVKITDQGIWKDIVPLDTDKKQSNISSYIDEHTYGEIYNGSKLNSDLPPFSPEIHEDYGFHDIPQSTIFEYSITNKLGLRYNFGLPVFVRNNTDLSVDCNADDYPPKNEYISHRPFQLAKIDNKYLVKNEALTNDEKNHNIVMGQINTNVYAQLYLLTSILSPDYVDVNNNGPDEYDFGGWTKFNYKRRYGGNDQWYRFRTPYTGFSFNRNSISSSNDDMGSVNTGEKEVYYLKSIETKSHIAFFVTNEFVDDYDAYNIGSSTTGHRRDGYGAKQLGATGDPAAESGGRGAETLERLERIVLFAKNKTNIPQDPIKTVHFQYDYSLVSNLPNSEKGKLTLKKVWTEYGGVVGAKISPYEFRYHYKTNIDDNAGEAMVAAPYFNEYMEYNGIENPSYTPYLLDTWGGISAYSRERYARDIKWIYQGQLPAGNRYRGYLHQSWRENIGNSKPAVYDPAAWHLKQIILPSGGEIHVQYEQKDYRYVQDKEPVCMVSLIDYKNNSYSRFRADFPRYCLNLDDIGINGYNKEEVDAYAGQLKAYFGLEGDVPAVTDKIYYKMLFALIGNNPSLEDKSSEYITGYANVEFIDVIEDPLLPSRWTIEFKLGSENSSGGDRASTPRQAAYDFYINRRQGILPGEMNNDYSRQDAQNYIRSLSNFVKDAANNNQAYLPEGNAPDKPLKTGIFKSSLREIALNLHPVGYKNKKPADVGKYMCPELSYLKVPMFKTKRGGGARVKRLLMYDNGLETGDAVVYGTQYNYVLEDGQTSSGVASNEPGGAREENPFVKYLPRKGQGIFSRLTAGEDVKQTEGPLGESIMPSPSITYSRVVAQNIHTGETGTGFSVHEFFTTKDYPVDRYYPESDDIAIIIKETAIQQALNEIEAPLTEEAIDRMDAFIDEAYAAKYKTTTDYAGNTVKYYQCDELATEISYLLEQTDLECVEECPENCDAPCQDPESPECLECQACLECGDRFQVNNVIKELVHYIFHYTDQGNKTKVLDVSGNGVEKTNLASNTRKDYFRIPMPLLSLNKNVVWSAQGFRFIKTNMEGQPKRNTMYGGDYLSECTDKQKDTDNGYIVSYQETEFFRPGEKIRMLKWDHDLGRYTETYDIPGKEEEIVVADKKIVDNTIDFSIELDIGATISVPPTIDIGVWPTIRMCENRVSLHATTKVFSYPCIVKCQKSYQDGIHTEKENIAFCSLTGQPLISKTYDSYHGNIIDLGGRAHNGTMYSLTMPAAWKYPQMGPKHLDDNNTNQLSATTASISTYARRPCPHWFSHETDGLHKDPENVLGISVQTFSNEWEESWEDQMIKTEYFENNPQISNLGTVKSKLNMVYRPEASWVYKNPGVSSDAGSEIYNTGFYSVSKMFDWEDAASCLKPEDNEDPQTGYWLKVSEVTKYSPNGNPLEEKNMANIFSAVLYGKQYSYQVPIMVAQNARQNVMFFEDFEGMQSNPPILGRMAHSGGRFFEIGPGGDYQIANLYIQQVDPLEQVPHPLEKGGIIKVWAGNKFNDGMLLFASIDNGNKVKMKKVAQTGEWALFEARLPAAYFPNGSQSEDFTVAITNMSSQNIYIDDVRFQPTESQATCYVYDMQQLKLVAQFDDQHFGIFFQYNDEGNLVRKRIETERGVKTIQENQYNTFAKKRD